MNEGINKNDVEQEYSSSNPEIVVVDNFLTDEFLNELQVFFRCSNIFKYPYSRGYIGAFLGKGMANKAILEFSHELQSSFQKYFLIIIYLRLGPLNTIQKRKVLAYMQMMPK